VAWPVRTLTERREPPLARAADNIAMQTAYDELSRLWTRLHHLQHLQAMAAWDQAAMMPAKGAQARANAMAEMEGLLHGMRTDPRLADLLMRAAGEDIDPIAQANLREMRREWRAANALPPSLVEAVSLAGARCEHAWRAQRPANDWTGFLGNFREVLTLGREVAQRLADQTGLAPYDALMDQYEPGTTSADIDRVFGDLQQWLPGLVAQVHERQAREPVIAPVGPFPRAAQRALSLEVMALLGFDFDRGRLDESAHPFSGGVPEDTRLTTRYRDDDLMQSLMGTIHETGHARYEQNLPRPWLGQPVSRARSMGIHESQSLSFEMQLGRGRPFAGMLAPLLRRHFGAQAAFEPDNLHRLMTRVAPGLIRVDADELTYPAHVILRYGIEKRLIDGSIEAEDIPALWDDGMQSLLGIDTRGKHADGCLQDVHWAGGAFGYFPCYTLGAMYAAQWFAAIRSTHADLDSRIGGGDLSPVFDWLRDHIWTQGSRWSTLELAQRASGEALNPTHFRRHLASRYLG
jgi:carboxypeptidase Taq